MNRETGKVKIVLDSKRGLAEDFTLFHEEFIGWLKKLAAEIDE